VAEKQHTECQESLAKGIVSLTQIQEQETRLPKIESRKTQRSDSSLPKLQS
jgi:hypothetical protein